MTCCRFETTLTVGRSTSSGNEVMRSMALFTSFSARSVSAPSNSSTRVLACPSVAEDVTFLTPSMPRTASSTASTTACSTSAGLAPGYVMLTETMSSSTSGNTSCLIPEARVTRPPTIKMSIRTLDATGFWAIQATGPCCLSGSKSSEVVMGRLVLRARSDRSASPEARVPPCAKACSGLASRCDW